MALERRNFIHAAGRVATDGTRVGPPAGSAAGWTSVRNGAGDYTITLDNAIDATEAVVHVEGETTLLISRVVFTSDTAIQILFVTVAAGNAATDSAFMFTVEKIAF